LLILILALASFAIVYSSACDTGFSAILHLSFRHTCGRARRVCFERIGGLKPTLPKLKEIIKEIRSRGKEKFKNQNAKIKGVESAEGGLRG
jgi:hypothetical protein